MITLAACLLISSASVTFADVGVHKVPKTENTSLVKDGIVLVDDASVISFENYKLNGTDISAPDGVAILSPEFIVPAGSVSFLKLKKNIYRSPDIERKWIWYYSLISNI